MTAAGTGIRLIGVIAAIGCAALCLWGCWSGPLPFFPVAICSASYALALWRWPGLFLLAIPLALPFLDLSLWAGSTAISEADIGVLATLAVLLVRAPPGLADLPHNRLVQAALALLLGALFISTILGLLSPLGDTGQSANPYLRPDNALRLAKGPIEALALFPFLRARQRMRGDALPRLGMGIALGLIAVTLIVLIERALFAGIFDFRSDYRVAGPFASMHIGGGHIGAYTALALPFAMALMFVRGNRRAMALGALATAAGGYTLLVTFARTGYAAGAIGCAIAGLGLLLTLWRRGGTARLLALAPMVLLLAAVAGAASVGVMRQRIAIAATDLVTRETNWHSGWAVRDRDLLTDAIGMGLGTYQRTMLSRASINRPSDFGLGANAEGPFVWVRMESPFYLGQKITAPGTGSAHLSLRFRADTPDAGLGFSLCDKVLLYSDNCQSGQFTPRALGDWEQVTATLPLAALGAGFGPIRRPVELSLFGSKIGISFSIRDVSLTDDAGQSLISNGRFAEGMSRWLLTDDSHVSWRILNVYLMLLFETGIFGLLAYLGIAGLATAGGIRAALQGDPMGSAIAGSVVSFLVSGLFDHVLEAPRLATLFILICGAGLLAWERGRT